MGAIKGDLSVLSLANLVQALVLDRSKGLLTLESGADRRILRVSPTGIRLVRGSQRCHRLERLLRRVGWSSTDSPDESPTRSNLFNRAAVSRLVREWMLEEICDLFTWSRGMFVFEKADPAEALEEGPFGEFAADCDITTIAIEAARWADELPRIKGVISDLRQVPVRTDAPVDLQTHEFDAEALDDILRLIDGCRPVVQILQLSVFPRFIVLQILYRLTLEGAIRICAPGEIAAAA